MLLRKRASSAPDSGGSRTRAGVLYCLSPLLFEGSGGLLLKSPSGLTVQSVLRLTSHCSLRAHISVQEWLNAASAIGGITNDVAQNIFDALWSISAKTAEARVQQSRSILSKMGESLNVAPSSATNQAVMSALGGRTVSLPAMMIFLICQIALEKYPLTNEDAPKTVDGVTESDFIVSFIKQHLHEIVSAVAVTKAGRVSMGDLAELRILLREFLNGSEVQMATNLGFLWPRGEQTVDCSVVSQYIREHLVSSSEVRAAAASYVHHTGLPASIHVITSAPPLKPSSLLCFSQCAQSSIYVLAALPSTLLVGLTNCLVVLGPIAGVLTVQACERCQIVSLCGAVSVSSDCTDVDVFVCSNAPPIYRSPTGVKTDEATVRFGPYNTFYSTLEEHLTLSGVNPKLNFFRTGLPPANIIPPQGPDGFGFAPFVVPASPSANNSVTTRTNPCPIPPEYTEELASRAKRFNQTSEMLQNAYKQLEANNRRDLAESLRTKVHHSFMDWLLQNGQAKGILDLLSAGGSSSSSVQ